MLLYLKLFIIFEIFSFVKSQNNYSNSNKENEILKNGKLIFAHVLFRHGDRTPIDPYPTDPYRDLSEWPTGWGQITNLGKQQHYILGQWLRKRYDSLVNETYSKNDIYIRSTDVDRTLMSALSNLAGFFPPIGTDIWNQNLLWQPIPVHTIPEHKDKILAAKKSCPAYDYALNKLRNSDEFKKLDKKYSQIYKYLTEKTGKKIQNMQGVQYIYGILFIEDLFNKTLPEWTKSVYPDKLKPISARQFATSTYTRDLARLKSGPLLKDILIRFKNKTNHDLKPNRNLWFYSAHDTTVANLLNTLKVFDYQNPPYRACVMLELREFNGDHFVSIFYKNTTNEPFLLHINECGKVCSLDKMFDLYADVLPDDWESECQINESRFASLLSLSQLESNTGSTILVVVIGVAVIILIFSLLSIVKIWYRRREYVDQKLYCHINE